MTKRFQLFQHKNEEYILDEPNTHLDFIEMLGDALTFEEVVDLLNEQHEDNQLLHKMNADTIDFMYDNFDLSIIFTDRELNNICNEMGWELSEKGIKIAQLEKENEQLKSELNGMEELLKSYQKTIKHDAKLLADATKNGYLPPLDDWEEISL